jgi:hypothetical protein
MDDVTEDPREILVVAIKRAFTLHQFVVMAGLGPAINDFRPSTIY